jgi:hypothetical protein
MSASLQETIAYLHEQFKKEKGNNDDSNYFHTVEIKEIHASLDKGGLSMIDTMIDVSVGFGRRVQEVMVKFSYDPPTINVPCEVKQSDHGRGVFATRDIKKGETITLYPAHCLATPIKNKQDKYDISGGCEYDWEYALNHSKTGEIHTGDKEMEDPLFLGHLINDFCSFVGEFKQKGKGQGANFMKYFIHALAFQNVEFKCGKHFLTIVARKDIKEGEELLVAYSPAYWSQLDPTEVVEQTYEYIESQTDPKKGLYLCGKFEEYMSRKY